MKLDRLNYEKFIKGGIAAQAKVDKILDNEQYPSMEDKMTDKNKLPHEAANEYADDLRKVAMDSDQMIQYSVSLGWAMQMVRFAFLDGHRWEKEQAK